MRNSIPGFTILAALAGATLLTACGGSDEAKTDSTPQTSTVAVKASLNTVDSNLGQIVTDQSGRTLYAFTKDTNGVSTCYDACAAAWPPALTSDTELNGNGVDSDLIGTADRKDGTKQLTLNGMPLYRFAADGETKASTKGQANKGVWYVLDSDGALVKQAAPAATTTTTAAAKKPASSGSYSYDYSY
jgi:predicted lipoprotein with Yx(FWY)xxD motif